MTEPIHKARSARLFVAIIATLMTGCWPGCPGYVYMKEQDGEGELAKSSNESKVRINEARSNLEVAKLQAQSEVARAEGVAQANRIIGESLKQNEAYLRWLWIKGLEDNKDHQIIYVPTEAGLPILEAERLRLHGDARKASLK